MKKRFLSMILCLSMVLSLFAFAPINASAAESGKCGDNVTWYLDDNGTLTISGTGDMWKQTTEVWTRWRYGAKKLIIDSGVTSIGPQAFFSCENLTEVSIPNTVKSIGEQAFLGCESLTNIVIPHGVTVIESNVFVTCRGLKSITLPNSIRQVHPAAFGSIFDLEDVYFEGTEEEWNNIKVEGKGIVLAEKVNMDYFWCIKNATIHFNSTGESTTQNTAQDHIGITDVYSLSMKNVTSPSTPKSGKSTLNHVNGTGDKFEFTIVTSQKINEITICGDKPNGVWYKISHSYLKNNYGLKYVDKSDGTRVWTCRFDIHDV